MKQQRAVIVRTHYDPKPIPDRKHDWIATLDNYEPGEPIGAGETEPEAVYCLYEEITLRETEEEPNA